MQINSLRSLNMKEPYRQEAPITEEKIQQLIYDQTISQSKVIESKILHGTNHERLNSFENERKQATEITRLALFKCLCLFGNYSGDDLNFGFGEI